MNSKIENILSRMADLDHQTVNKNFIGMLYGEPGTGKTTLAVGLAHKLANGGKVLYLDSSDGWVSLENIPSLMKNVVRLPFEQYQDMPQLASALKEPDSKRPKLLKGVKVVVVDELSSISNDVLDTVLRERTGTKDDEIPDVVAEWSDYYPQKELIRKAVIQLHEVPGLHVVLVAHAKEKTDHRKVKVMKPDFPDKLLGELQKIMHLTAYVSATTTNKGGSVQYTRLVQSQPSLLISAKSRIGGLPFQTDFTDFVEHVVLWTQGENMAEDLVKPEPDVELVADELPADGIPPADSDDDEPVVIDE